METQTFKVRAGETCKVDMGVCGTTVEGPAIVVVVKEEAAKFATANGICVVCKNNKNLLYVEDGEGLCDDCAQYMNDMAP